MDYLSYLPEELIDGVCEYIPDRDGLHDLRLCCKRLYSKTQHAFDVRHFSVVQCKHFEIYKTQFRLQALMRTMTSMLTPGSLQKLIDLSRNGRTRGVIQEVHLCIVNFDEWARSQVGEDIWDRWRIASLRGVFSTTELEMLRSQVLEKQEKASKKKIRRQQRRLHSRHMHEHNRLRNTGADVELLAEALKNLPSLHTIHSASKFRYSNPPLGARQVFRDIGTWPRIGTSSRIGTIHSIYVVLGALLRSKVRIRSLGLWAQPEESLAHVPNEISSRRGQRKGVPRRTFTESQIVNLGLSQLRDLSFEIAGHFAFRPYSTVYANPPSWFLVLAPRLPHLQSLNFDAEHSETMKAFLQMLVSNEHIFPGLRSLRLVCLSFPNADFETLLKRLALTLQHLEIRDPRPIS
ncbi:hypothetical protein BKA63DRAFT_312243 [Paraphoma chrysanthemicola]|nr:hypothetical protein BKA63DRAFT_312243 [Paraphoma chrysanthemicola]